jgi:hypothetical protein
MPTDNRAYYQGRAKRERMVAANSLDGAVAQAHLKMAEEYQRRAEGYQAEMQVAQR